MSFEFPRPVAESRNNHYELMRNPEPDYDELLIRLSLYAFNRLSPGDQRKQMEEIGQNINVEDVKEQSPDEAFRLTSFAELFKKLNFAEQRRFLSKVTRKFKRERQLGELMSSFQKLDAKHQQQLIEKIVHDTPENLRNPGETEEDFRLRRFTQLSRDYTDHVYKLVVAWKKSDRDQQEETSDNENGSDWKSCFAEFFLGSSIVWFQGQSPSSQDRVVEQLSRGVSSSVVIENRLPHESEEDFRLRRFTQLSRYYKDHVVAWKKSDQVQQEETSDNKNGSDCFSEFFLGFSIVWFQGQSSSSQDRLTEQLSSGVRSSVAIENRLPHESEEDFKLRRFTELCKQVVDFEVQEKFLKNAEEKLKQWQRHDHYRWVVEPQDSDSAAELLSSLLWFGFNLQPAMYQQKKIDEMSNQVEGVEIETSPADEEGIRMTRFKELFNQVPVRTRIHLFQELRKMLLQEKRYSEAVRFFRGLGSEDQIDMIEKLSDGIMNYGLKKYDPAELIIEKFSGESEEDFRLRRFEKVCSKHVSTIRSEIVWPEADRERVRQVTTEESRYSKFLFDVSITWFKARCGNYRRNPIHVILFGQVEFSDVIQKLPEESEEDFKLRRFTESFKQLEFTHQVQIVNYIQHTLFGDLGHSERKEEKKEEEKKDELVKAYRSYAWPFDSEWIKIKLPDLQDQGATSTTQAGGGSGQGTSRQPSASTCTTN